MHITNTNYTLNVYTLHLLNKLNISKSCRFTAVSACSMKSLQHALSPGPLGTRGCFYHNSRQTRDPNYGNDKIVEEFWLQFQTVEADGAIASLIETLPG